MQFDTKTESWKPAHDADLRLRSPWMLAVALALVALGTAALIAGPDHQQKPRAAVAAVLP
ncbi:MAG TPA: hypothetical protein VFA79_05825 [Myxococcales bacterium]|nr:hypothetical protein [Myxococcales bacterium]